MVFSDFQKDIKSVFILKKNLFSLIHFIQRFHLFTNVFQIILLKYSLVTKIFRLLLILCEIVILLLLMIYFSKIYS